MSEETEQITIHYEGEKLKEHRMPLEEFLYSLEGFNSLVLEISKEFGLDENDIKMEIAPLEDGGLKAIIWYAIGALTTVIGGNFADHLLDDLKAYETVKTEIVIKAINTFLDKKKSFTTGNNISELTSGLSNQNIKVMKNKKIHEAAEQFTSVLSNSIDYIEIIEKNENEVKKITKNELEKFKNPFAISSKVEIEEDIYEEEKVLRLDGPRGLGSEWYFYEKNEKGEWDLEKIFKAEVLDTFLLSIGRENSLESLRDKDLYCIVRIKWMKKAGNKRSSSKRYIISCRLEPYFKGFGHGNELQ